MNYEEIIESLKLNANPKNVDGMARFGINSHGALGVSVPVIRSIAKEAGKDYALAWQLWNCGIHEAKWLSGLVFPPEELSGDDADELVAGFDSWDICDSLCMNLLDRCSFTRSKITQWADDDREYVRRAGFAVLASIALHDKKAPDEDFIEFFPLIKKHSTDERNFVRKAVNWALRQIGKRNRNLNNLCTEFAIELTDSGNKTARWIAMDTIRELTDVKILARLDKMKR